MLWWLCGETIVGGGRGEGEGEMEGDGERRVGEEVDDLIGGVLVDCCISQSCFYCL